MKTLFTNLVYPALVFPLFLSYAETPGPSANPPDVRSSVLQYPAEGNIHLDEGTIEIYVTAGFQTEKTKVPHTFQLFELKSPTTQEKALIFYYPSVQRLAMVGYLKPLAHGWVLSRKEGIDGYDWQSGSHHLIAFTWKGNSRQFFVDGEPGLETEVEGPLNLNLSKAIMRFGSPVNALWTLDEVRISSVRRTPEELKEGVSKQPQADAYTLFLDHFDSDTPAVTQGNPGKQVRQVEGNPQKVEGKFGGAIKLW